VSFKTSADLRAIESEMSWEARRLPVTLYAQLQDTAAKFGQRPAISFQILSGPGTKAETLTWEALRARVTQAANLFRRLGVGPTDVVAYVLPNCNETAIALLGGATAGIVNPINPLLDPEQIAAILRETKAKVVVTLKPFPKTDLPQKVAQAVAGAPDVRHVLEVDLNRYLSPPKSWIVPMIRPKVATRHHATVGDFNALCAAEPRDLTFSDPGVDRDCAYFHTGGTTGMPKIARHRFSGMLYNGWIGHTLLFRETDVILCPLPLFHVFACNVILMAMVRSGAHGVFPTPQGYRGEGVMDNIWKLIARWKVTFLITVPTAIAAKMQRKVDADISSLKTAFSGSSPLPVELFKRFEAATGVKLVEGYGLTEATCLVSCNPVDGEKRIGTVGFAFPYTAVRILDCTPDGKVVREHGPGEVGEICVSSPGVAVGQTYTDASKNKGLYADHVWLRTGDLGRIDPDGYITITGRAKDIIIRGGHNIDPAEIEEALAGHPAVAFVGAIGQPDAVAGELPCAYVELVAGASVTVEALMDHARAHVHERAAHPKHIEILPELPKTAVGKVFKPDLRRRAITRVLNGTLAEDRLAAEVAEVVEDKRRGLVARVRRTGTVDTGAVERRLGEFAQAWEWAD
jgi:acyl-CoA synthetase (AMP-forming)/AMP-acid ligase II